MHAFFTKLLEQVENELQTIRPQYTSNRSYAEVAAVILTKSYAQLQNFVIHYRFSSEQEEIDYFKVLKPQITSKLIYYQEVYELETNKPQGSNQSKKKYFMNKLDRLYAYFCDNIDFIRYYRAECTHLDHLYFVRQSDFNKMVDFFSVDRDKVQCTHYDTKVATHMAHDRLQVYLDQEIYFLETSAALMPRVEAPLPKLSWTGSKAALVELIYGLQFSGALNNGNAEIKDLAAIFEHAFNIKLGDYYRAFVEIRSRKTARTKFLDTLRENLERKMDDL